MASRKREFLCTFDECEHVSCSVKEHETHHHDVHKRQQPEGGFFKCELCNYRSNSYRMSRVSQHCCRPIEDTPRPPSPLPFPEPLNDIQESVASVSDGTEQFRFPVIAASEFADKLVPLVSSLAGQLRASCLMPWGTMSSSFAAFAVILARSAEFAVKLGLTAQKPADKELPTIVSDLIKSTLLLRPDELRGLAFEPIFPPRVQVLPDSTDSVYVLDIVGWLHHLANSDQTVWQRLKSPPQPRDDQLVLPTDGLAWKRICAPTSTPTLCVVLSVDGMNWADALRVGGHNGKTIAVYITVVLGPEFLSHSSAYSVAMFAPASLLTRHSRADVFAPLLKQLRLLIGILSSSPQRC